MIILILPLSGCVAVSLIAAGVSALGGVAVDKAAYVMAKEKVSLPIAMPLALAVVQTSLKKLNFKLNLLEPTPEGGYNIIFGNKALNGKIILLKETDTLTTYAVGVHTNQGLTRHESIETAVTNMVAEQSKIIKRNTRFNFRSFNSIRQQPNPTAPRVGWFRNGSALPVELSGIPGWLKIKMLSGKKAFLKGTIADHLPNPHLKRK
ncbi:MAG: hypothetical protein Q9M26_04745 [Mariprofundales bacterium]|nr:hypothetical protein [Mariprofundales bacterium]